MMYQRLVIFLGSLSCIILMMPQGWCCWLFPMQCCPVVANKACCETVSSQKNSFCCQATHSNQNQSESPSSLPLKCAKCIHDSTKPNHYYTIDVELGFLCLLPIDELFLQPLTHFTPALYLHGASPPLHVRLCVWRC